MIELQIQGVTLRADARTRRVMWCSDWARIWELPGLERDFAGPGTFGHVDFIVPR